MPRLRSGSKNCQSGLERNECRGDLEWCNGKVLLRTFGRAKGESKIGDEYCCIGDLQVICMPNTFLSVCLDCRLSTNTGSITWSVTTCHRPFSFQNLGIVPNVCSLKSYPTTPSHCWNGISGHACLLIPSQVCSYPVF